MTSKSSSHGFIRCRWWLTGWAPGQQPGPLAVTLWSVAQGFAALWAQGPLPEQFDDDVDALGSQVVDAVIRIT